MIEFGFYSVLQFTQGAFNMINACEMVCLCEEPVDFGGFLKCMQFPNWKKVFCCWHTNGSDKKTWSKTKPKSRSTEPWSINKKKCFQKHFLAHSPTRVSMTQNEIMQPPHWDSFPSLHSTSALAIRSENFFVLMSKQWWVHRLTRNFFPTTIEISRKSLTAIASSSRFGRSS